MVIRNPSRFPNTWPKLHLLLTLSGTYCETRTAQAKILTEPAVTEEQMVLL